MTSPNNYTITLKLDLDFQTTFHVVERGWSAGLASIYMSVHEILVNCRFGMKLSASVSSPSYTGAQKQDGPDPTSSNVESSVSDDSSWKEVLFGSAASPIVATVPTAPIVPFVATVPVVATIFVVPIADTVSTAPVHSGAVVKYCRPTIAPIAAAVSTGSAVVKFIPFSPIYVQSAPVATSACAVVRRIPYYSTFSIPSCLSLPGAFNRTLPSSTSVSPIISASAASCAVTVSSEASAEAPIEVPTEAACSAVESAFSPAVAAQAMVSVLDCDVVASPLAVPTNLAPHSYDKPFWERSSRRKVVALPSLHMAMVDYNDWLITYDSRGSVVFQPRETVV
ncbi:hypothetical protein BASA50_005087 [Batrachochytrium salamandrivorans]|uniref:Uncharacterized protein n=1 Tax=Batrachochytrium salamandrivorans TaxID=1357716 RepID=A0ABQ8FDF5_9FUNG|nr:hypothetical protein BASA50_005087 [Batrachochytrium salamandrivorans]KAH9265451.1 hypothetical protein BASA84_001724 [Batrachochytrium salamandrivorans]